MNDIIYETETARDIVFEGDMPLDGHMTPEQQRQSIFDLMKEIGIPFDENASYEIGYEGASDNNGISETQTTHFVVTKVYQKQVPFLLNREQVFEGDWVLDGLKVTPEEQRRRILEEARKNGVAIENENEYEIGYEGASDNEGISETQTSHYVVYHVTTKRLSDEELREYMLHGSHQKEYLQNIHEELMVLRQLVRNTNNPEELSRLSTRMEEISDLLDSLVDESTRDYTPFEKALGDVEEQIQIVKDGILANMKAYDESYDRMKQLLKDQTELVDGAMDVQDFDERVREIMNEKQGENADSYSIHEIIDRQIADLKKLTKKRDKIRKDFEMAKELGISAFEYRELSDNFRSRKLVNAILEKKGLGDIIAIPAKDRTPEQKRRIRTVRREVLEELARMKKENEDKSVLKLVEALYGIETEVKLKGKQRVLLVKEGSLERIRKNAQKMPEKIPGKEEKATYQPGATPEDMKEVLEKRAADEEAAVQAQIDKINSLRRVVLYQDARFPGKYFAPETIIAEFNLLEEGDPIVFGDDTCYEIAGEDVDYILSNATNEEDPYVVEIRRYPKQKEMVREGLGPIPYNDEISTITDEPFAPRGLMDQLTVFIDEDNRYYVRKPAFARFDVEPIGEEVRLDGTAGYEINPDDVRRIVENQNNEVSPYSVLFRPSERHLVKREAVREDPPIVSYDDYEGARGLKDQLTIFIDEDGKYYVRKPAFARFDVEPIGEEVRLHGAVGGEISVSDARAIVENQNNDVSPYDVVFRKIDLGKTRENPPVVEEESTPSEEAIYVDEDNKYYVKKPVLDKHQVQPIGEDVHLDGEPGNEISYGDARHIFDGQRNPEDPYNVVFKKVDMKKVKEEPPIVEEAPVESDEFIPGTQFKKPRERGIYETDQEYVEYLKNYYDSIFNKAVGEKGNAPQKTMGPIPYNDSVSTIKNEAIGPIPYNDAISTIKPREVFTIYRNQNNPTEFYARKYVFERFDIEPIGAGVRVAGALCYPIAVEDVQAIDLNANNSTSPYEVVYMDISLTSEKEPVKDNPEVVHDQAEDTMHKERGLTDQISVFIDEDGKYYVRKPVFDRFDVEPVGEEVRLDGVAGHEIDFEDLREIVENQNNDVSPYSVVYRKAENHLQRTNPVKEDPPVVTQEEYDSKRGLMDQVSVFIDEDGKYYVRKPVFDRFDVEPVGEEVRLDGVAGHEINVEDLREIVDNQNNDVSPYSIVYRKAENHLQRENPVKEEPPVVEENVSPRGLVDQVSVFIDEDNKYYVRKPVFDRFDVEPVGEEVRLDGVAGHEISLEDLREIVENQNNDVSPYRVLYRKVDFPKKEEAKEVPPVVEEGLSSDSPVEQIRVFISEDGKYYVRKPVFERFDSEPIGEEVRLGGVAGYEINLEDLREIVENQNNDVSPYRVVYSPVTFGEKDKTPTKEEKPKKKPKEEEESEKEEVITLFRDTNDNLQVYAPDDVLQNFGIKTLAEPTMVQDVPCHKISRDTDQIINSIAKMSHNPKLVIHYVDLPIKELEDIKPRPHVEEIIDKVTDGLDIRAKDCKHYNASNIRVARGFVDELRSGNYAYNIVHIVPATLKAGVGFFRKLGGNIFSTARGRESMESIEKRLGELSEEELEVLFEEYKGSQLKTDMNNQINPLVLERLRKFGLDRVTTLNHRIQKDYVALFTLLGQIKALEEKMKDEDASSSLESQRQAYMKEASKHVQAIVSNRKKANDLLSSGIHGLEEDFKAVSTKLSYVGMRFAKTNDFDNDLQHKLGQLGRKLNTALAAGDDEAIVQNFMGLETCYYENTAIRGSLAGKRSVGTKYYSPVAEQFDYRDDPFIRDLFTTVAVTSAAISAINAIRVHQIESQELNDQVAHVNAENKATMDQVHQTASEISGKRETFREGMEAQAEQDILTNADVRERAHLDLTNWKFNDAYHAADHAGHAAYNQFGIDVNNQIQAVTNDYATGAITQAQALERMAQISSNAQSTLRDVVDSSLPILRDYAASHPQFDLSAVEKSMEYIVAHPTAIADMNQAMVDVTNLADGLQGLQASEMSAIGTLPSDMASTLVCAASAVLLATNVSNSLGKAPKKGTYGNEITDMMEEYINGETPEDEKEKVAQL